MCIGITYFMSLSILGRYLCLFVNSYLTGHPVGTQDGDETRTEKKYVFASLLSTYTGCPQTDCMDVDCMQSCLHFIYRNRNIFDFEPTTTA